MATLKESFEKQVARERFSLRALFSESGDELAGVGGCGPLLAALEDGVTGEEYTYLVQGLLRTAFLIELVKQPKIETTKFEVRWADRLPTADPRHASYRECAGIFEELLGELVASLGNADATALWRTLLAKHLLPYEIPSDYQERRIEDPIHRRGNFRWLWDDEGAARAVHLRSAVTDPDLAGDEATVFVKTLKKIRVKTYLTDRVLTGTHKTNREKRWEVHPGSVHFATRAQCLAIERELVEQLCFFRGFPETVRKRLADDGLLEDRPESRCPVTQEPLVYEEFVREVGEPLHGKANFQVGHLHPLKADPTEPTSGHTYENVSWISADGNRIQGSYSLEETRSLLRTIAQRYEEGGWGGKE